MSCCTRLLLKCLKQLFTLVEDSLICDMIDWILPQVGDILRTIVPCFSVCLFGICNLLQFSYWSRPNLVPSLFAYQRVLWGSNWLLGPPLRCLGVSRLSLEWLSEWIHLKFLFVHINQNAHEISNVVKVTLSDTFVHGCDHSIITIAKLYILCIDVVFPVVQVVLQTENATFQNGHNVTTQTCDCAR